jgi:membrane associated rhomboid family serine protease
MTDRTTHAALPARPIVWLTALNLAVLVLAHAVLSAGPTTEALRLDPGNVASRPWTLVTYPFVHRSLAHLGLVTLLLALVGPGVVRHMGARRFAAYYLAAAVGAGLVALLLATLVPVPPLLGGLGPALGVLFARAWYAEDGALPLQPIPARIRVRTALAIGAGVLAMAAVLWSGPGLSVAHFGGLLMGYGWFRVQGVARHPVPPPALPARRPVMAPVRRRAEAPAAPAEVEPATTPEPARPASAPDRGELDRLLDKISASGLDSLTPAERDALDAYAERKRHDEEPR